MRIIKIGIILDNINIKESLKKLQKINSKQVSIRNIIDILDEKAAQIIIIILCAPTALPIPALPVLTQILSSIVIITLLQLFIGKKSIWLPKKLNNKKVNSETIHKSVGKLIHYHEKIEGIIKPRIKILSSAIFNKIIFLFCIFLSMVVALPIPFSNTVPSMAIIVIMLGIIEKDGILILLGILLAIIGVTTLFLGYFYGINAISDITT